MLTLITLIMIWLVISTIRIKKACKGKDFNPLEGTMIDFTGFILGTTVTIVVIITICIVFLP